MLTSALLGVGVGSVSHRNASCSLFRTRGELADFDAYGEGAN